MIKIKTDSSDLLDTSINTIVPNIPEVGKLLDKGLDLLKNSNQGPPPSIVIWSKGKVSEEILESSIEKPWNDVTGLGRKINKYLEEEIPENFSSFKFDAVISETHSSQSNITKFPVSSGFLVSDHVIKQNRILVLDTTTSNMVNSATWSGSVQGMSTLSGSLLKSTKIQMLGGVLGSIGNSFETADRLRYAYNLFENFRKFGVKVHVNTILGTYLNCIVTRIDVTQDMLTSTLLKMKVVLEELQIIDEDDVTLDAKNVLQNARNFSPFGKAISSYSTSILGGGGLPGLGDIGTPPTKMLSTLKGKLSKLSSPISGIKGRLGF